ncbi:GatB/YqeY domain-containing protein [Defluviimonas salinarum]|uniref:GatB/YqeY domain-containing protein n=1 Tax=Defluviimonas salinarum TaxID=2992147 RepID=A0ABT3J5E5_9RHOB|nr:GatB/YqeY domain-containing protein [Defluviimonas salinarum]MCW3782912.1 GatB/YqeY domain-containing protein [Defluviimonas salinarum]
MSLLEKIRADALAARKAKAPEAGVLVTLKGEIDTKTKLFNPAREMTDDEVVAVVKKFLKGIEETIVALEGGRNPDALAKVIAEKRVLEGLLPAQMTAPDIEAFARARIAAGADLGAVMAALKAEHSGLYDGKLASGIVRGLLAAAA